MKRSASSNHNQIDPQKIHRSVMRFVHWLDQYGEVSYDHQSYFAGSLGRKAKALYYSRPLLGMIAVSPMILSEAFLPSARRFFWKPQRLPIADAHYAMGFAFLFNATGNSKYYARAVHFLEVLKETRAPGFEHYAWGYPFHWQTRTGTMQMGTPLITTVPYAYEAFAQVYEIDHKREWLDIMASIAKHVCHDYRDFSTSATASSCAYNTDASDRGGVINASAYRAFMLTRAGIDFEQSQYLRVAERNLNFVLESQNPDGSWFYSTDGTRDFVDHFHTCFVLKALAKIEAITGDPAITAAIERGVTYYVQNLFDEQGLPKPFSRKPRLTVYRHELYDYAECINLALLLAGRFPDLDACMARAMQLDEWQKQDGSFRARKLLIGWDNTPMHRWAQSQMFRSLACFLSMKKQNRSVNQLQGVMQA